MSTYSHQPENFNFFNPIGFKFEVDKLVEKGVDILISGNKESKKLNQYPQII